MALALPFRRPRLPPLPVRAPLITNVSFAHLKTPLLRIIPPRVEEVGLEPLVDLIAQLATQSTAGGMAYEIVGAQDLLEIRVRAHTAAQLDGIAGAIDAAFPGVRLIAVEDDETAYDTLALPSGTLATAREFTLAYDEHRPLAVADKMEAADRALITGLIGAMRAQPSGMTTTVQVALWPADAKWAKQIDTLRAEMERQEKQGQMIEDAKLRPSSSSSSSAAGAGGDMVSDVVSALVTVIVKTLLAPPMLLFVWPTILIAAALFALTQPALDLHVASATLGQLLGGNPLTARFAPGGVLRIATHIVFAGPAPHMALAEDLGGGALLSFALGFLLRNRKPRERVQSAQELAIKFSSAPVRARLGVLVTGGTDRERKTTLDAVAAAVNPSQAAGTNYLKLKKSTPAVLRNLAAGQGRLNLAAREASALVHVPGTAVMIAGLERGQHKQILPTNPMLLRGGVSMGLTTVGLRRAMVNLPIEAFLSHGLIPGSSGAGKSTFMWRLALWVLTLGRTVPEDDLDARREQERVRGAITAFDPRYTKPPQLLLVDPHGALARRVVASLTPEDLAHTAVLRFGAASDGSTLGYNLLDATSGRTPAQIVGSIRRMGKAYWGETWGPRMGALLENACLTLIACNAKMVRDAAYAATEAEREALLNRQYTLLDVPALLVNESVRAKRVAEAGDNQLTRYWKTQYDDLREDVQSTHNAPILYKLGAFAMRPAMRRVIDRPRTEIDLERMVREGWHIIIDTGDLVDDEAALMNTLLLSNIFDILRQRDVDHIDQPMLAIVDEFQAIPIKWSWVVQKMRAFGLELWAGTQGLAPIRHLDEETDLLEDILNNMPTRVVFATESDVDATRLAMLLDSDVTEYDVRNLPRREAYLKTRAGTSSLPTCSLQIQPYDYTDSKRAALLARGYTERYGTPNEKIDRYHAAIDRGGRRGEITQASPDPDEVRHPDENDGALPSMGPGSAPALGLGESRPATRDQRRNGGVTAARPPRTTGESQGKGAQPATTQGTVENQNRKNGKADGQRGSQGGGTSPQGRQAPKGARPPASGRGNNGGGTAPGAAPESVRAVRERKRAERRAQDPIDEILRSQSPSDGEPG